MAITPNPDIEGANDLLQALVGGDFWTLLVSFTVQLHIEVPGGTYSVQTGSSFTLHGPDGDSDIDPETSPLSVAPLLALLRVAKVVAISVTKPANLTMEFDSGHSFTIESNSHYEAWEVSGPLRMLVVATPGGDISIWGPGEGDVARDGKGTIFRGDA